MDQDNENNQSRESFVDLELNSKEEFERNSKVDDLDAYFKAQEEKRRKNEDLEKAFKSAQQTSIKRVEFVASMRPFLIYVGLLMGVASLTFTFAPKILDILNGSTFASVIGISGIIFLIAGTGIGFFAGVKEKTFVDIDDKIYNARAQMAEVEKDALLKKVAELEHKLKNYYSSDFVTSKIQTSAAVEKPDLSFFPTLSDSKNFDQYMKSLIRSLDMNIELAENKASLLLDKGTTYLWRGIVFYVLSIVLWQVATAYFKVVGDYTVWGMVSCSMTFLVVEFLAAWFLRQYKSFTDSSFNLVRVKSVFNRYFLSYLAIKEFSDSSQHLVDMRLQMLKVLEEDIKWLDATPQKAGELNHMVAMFESVSGLLEKLKTSSKTDSATAS